jgi:hypothetical protein
MNGCCFLPAALLAWSLKATIGGQESPEPSLSAGEILEESRQATECRYWNEPSTSAG